MVCSILKSETTCEDLEEMLFSLREKYSSQLHNSIGRFKTDGSRLAMDDFADKLNDEVMSNKVTTVSKQDLIGTN